MQDGMGLSYVFCGFFGLQGYEDENDNAPKTKGWEAMRIITKGYCMIIKLK